MALTRSYKKTVLALGPEAFIDWTDNPLVNLAVSENGGHSALAHSQTAGTFPAVDGTPSVYHSGSNSTLVVPLNNRYYSNSFTITGWASPASTTLVMWCRLNYGTTAGSNSRHMIRLRGGYAAGMYHTAYNSSGTAANSGALNTGTALNGALHHFAIRITNLTATTGNFEFFVNGVRTFNSGSSSALARNGTSATVLNDSVQFDFGTNTTRMFRVDNAFFGRALTNEEIRSMSVDYVALPDHAVLESGLEVPVDIEGESYFIPDNAGHQLVTNADLHYSSEATAAPTETSLSRNSLLPTTYMVWAKWNGTPSGTTGITSHQPGTTLSATSNNNLYVYTSGELVLNAAGGQTGAFITDHFTDGQWHHYTLVADNTNYSVYADGVLVTTKVMSRASVTLDTVLFGNLYSGTAAFTMAGELDDESVVSRVLSDTEIADIHAAGRSVVGGYRTRPLSIDGVYRAAVGAEAHSLVTDADFYYNGTETSEAIEIEHEARLSTLDTSYCMWANLGTTPQNTGIFGTQDREITGVWNSHNTLYLAGTQANLFASGKWMGNMALPELFDGNWHHFVMTVSGNDFKVYCDGALLAEQTITRSAKDNDTTRFGKVLTAIELPLNGSMDDCAVISGVLTPAQVADIYNTGRSLGRPAYIETF